MDCSRLRSVRGSRTSSLARARAPDGSCCGAARPSIGFSPMSATPSRSSCSKNIPDTIRGVITPLRIQIRRLPASHGLPLPTYMSASAAGMDLHAAVDADVVLAAGQIALIPTGLQVAIPDGYEGQVRPRSGLAVKHGVSLPNTPATIDADYRGEIRVPLINLGREPFSVARGMRIAQLVVAPVMRVGWEEVAELPETVRASQGFGHSGV